MCGDQPVLCVCCSVRWSTLRIWLFIQHFCTGDRNPDLAGQNKTEDFQWTFTHEAHALQQSRAWSCLKEGIRPHCSAVLPLNSGINWKLDNLLYQEQIAEFMWCMLSFKRFQFGLCMTWYKEVQDVVRLLPQPQKILGFPDPKLRCWGFLWVCSTCLNSEVVLHSR